MSPGSGETVWWASDCYFGASALALQRMLALHRYTLVAEGGEGASLVFVRNDLLPPGKGLIISDCPEALYNTRYRMMLTGSLSLPPGAHLPSLMSSNWVSKIVKNKGALHAPCRRRVWVRVSEGWGSGNPGDAPGTLAEGYETKRSRLSAAC